MKRLEDAVIFCLAVALAFLLLFVGGMGVLLSSAHRSDGD
jgi:hypothetical protein